MTTIRENLGHNTFLDDEGDIRSYEDVKDEFDRRPVSNESIIQGKANLARLRELEGQIDPFEADARRQREHMLAEHALAHAGPHSVIGEHRQTGLQILDAVATMSMYAGGEKGGYKTKDFNDRYGAAAPDVEGGARKNHQKLVRKTFPELLKASQLIEAGFTQYEVDDMVDEARIKLKRKFGGPENEKARSQMRARLKNS